KELGVKGYDPKDFTLLAYGGNGPLHCCGIAKVLDIDKVLVPPFSPIFSAVGTGLMDLVNIHERSVFMNIYDSNSRSLFDEYDRFNEIVTELENTGKEELLRQGVPEEGISHRLELDMRYGNQLTQTSVASPVNRLTDMTEVLQLVKSFSENYGERFGDGSQQPEAGIRINAIRVVSFVELEQIKFNEPVAKDIASPEPFSQRECYFVEEEGPVMTDIYRIELIEEGATVSGPALIESQRASYLIEPGWEFIMGQQNSGWIVNTANIKKKEEEKKAVTSAIK